MSDEDKYGDDPDGWEQQQWEERIVALEAQVTRLTQENSDLSHACAGLLADKDKALRQAVAERNELATFIRKQWVIGTEENENGDHMGPFACLACLQPVSAGDAATIYEGVCAHAPGCPVALAEAAIQEMRSDKK